jgi:hypothetical protein
MSRYAEGTEVPVRRSRDEIEHYIMKQGAVRFAFGQLDDRTGISFVANGYMVRFTIPLPSGDDNDIRKRALSLSRSNYSIDAGKLQIAIEEENRRRWRCLLLAIKSKFTTVQSGIETFEEAFLANIVTTDNMTVWERIKLEESGIRLLPAATP